MQRDANQIIDGLIDDKVNEIPTSIPAIVNSYNPVTQTAEVTLAVKRPLEVGTLLQPTILYDVPIVFPSGSGWVIGAPLAKGDGVLLFFPMYDMSNYLVGDSTLPAEALGQSFHTTANCYAIAGTFTYNSPKVSQNAEHNKKLHIVSDIGVVINTGGATVDVATDAVTITIGGMTMNVSSAGINITGGDIIADGKSLKTHTHTYQDISATGSPFPNQTTTPPN